MSTEHTITTKRIDDFLLLVSMVQRLGLPDLGQTQQSKTQPIVAPWTDQQSQPAGTDNSPPAADTPTPAASSSNSTVNELSFPTPAAFYYTWFPESWDQNGLNPYSHYQPTMVYYRKDNPTVIAQHIAAMQYGKIQVGIASWWGQVHYTDQRSPALLKAGEERGLRWSLYVENEG